MRKLPLLTASLLMLGAGAAFAASPDDTQTNVYNGQSTGSGYMQTASQAPNAMPQATQYQSSASQTGTNAPPSWPKNDALGGQGG